MHAIRVVGRIDKQHRLTADVPAAVPAGQVEVVLIVPDTGGDPAEGAWQAGIAREWAADLADELACLGNPDPLERTAPTAHAELKRRSVRTYISSLPLDALGPRKLFRILENAVNLAA